MGIPILLFMASETTAAIYVPPCDPRLIPEQGWIERNKCDYYGEYGDLRNSLAGLDRAYLLIEQAPDDGSIENRYFDSTGVARVLDVEQQSDIFDMLNTGVPCYFVKGPLRDCETLLLEELRPNDAYGK